jgi:phage-related protein
MSELPKPLRWRGTSRADFEAFPRQVQREMGYALYLAQMGERHATMAKTLTGFAGGAMIEIRESDRAGTYRAVYTVRFADAIYVLHAFQKKSKQGIRTPAADVASIERRLKELIAEKKP